METDALLHDITLLERKLHGIITQRERLGVSSKETEETEGELKKTLAEKKQKLRTIMEAGESPSKQPPRQPALIKNGVSLEMLAQVMEMEDKLCSTLPVIETRAIEQPLLLSFTGPTVVNDVPDDGAPNYILHPNPSSFLPPTPSSPSFPSSPSSSSPVSSSNTSPPPSPSQSSTPSNEPRFAACSFSTYPHIPEGAGVGRVPF